MTRSSLPRNCELYRGAYVVAELMGHAKVDTTLNVYTQVIDGAKLAAAQAVGNGLIEIERNSEGLRAPIH